MSEISRSENPDKFTELPISWEEKGAEKAKKEIVLEMLKEGSSTEFIAKVTRLTPQEIEELRELN